jgi:hypothetical protein
MHSSILLQVVQMGKRVTNIKKLRPGHQTEQNQGKESL